MPPAHHKQSRPSYRATLPANLASGTLHAQPKRHRTMSQGMACAMMTLLLKALHMSDLLHGTAIQADSA